MLDQVCPEPAAAAAAHTAAGCTVVVGGETGAEVGHTVVAVPDCTVAAAVAVVAVAAAVAVVAVAAAVAVVAAAVAGLPSVGHMTAEPE